MKVKITPVNADPVAAKDAIDRTGEVLIDPETSFDELLLVLKGRPERVEAEKVEREEQKRKAEEARLKAALGKDYSAFVEGQDQTDPLKKAKRRPGAIQLRTEVPRIAVKEIGDEGLCEVFANGYGIYDNGNRKTVLWVADCGSITYHFTKLRDNEKQYQLEKDTVGRDTLGPAPWYIALMLRGEDSIEYNLDHPKSIGTMSDSGKKEDFEVKPATHWIAGCHFDNPEEAYIKKEEAAELRRKVSGLKQKQRDAVDLYYYEENSQEEAAERLGISQSSFSERLSNARENLAEELKNWPMN